MKSYIALSTLFAATLTLASPAPSPATYATAYSSAWSTSVNYPASTGAAAATPIDSSANAAQSAAIQALLDASPEGPNHPNGTFMEIFVTSKNQMYIRYQHAHPDYREFNTTDGKAPPATGPGEEDDLGYGTLMEAINGGMPGSLGESMAKAWSLYKSYYGTLPTGVPSGVLSAGTAWSSAWSTSYTALPTPSY